MSQITISDENRIPALGKESITLQKSIRVNTQLKDVFFKKKIKKQLSWEQVQDININWNFTLTINPELSKSLDSTINTNLMNYEYMKKQFKESCEMLIEHGVVHIVASIEHGNSGKPHLHALIESKQNKIAGIKKVLNKKYNINSGNKQITIVINPRHDYKGHETLKEHWLGPRICTGKYPYLSKETQNKKPLIFY